MPRPIPHPKCLSRRSALRRAQGRSRRTSWRLADRADAIWTECRAGVVMAPKPVWPRDENQTAFTLTQLGLSKSKRLLSQAWFRHRSCPGKGRGRRCRLLKPRRGSPSPPSGFGAPPCAISHRSVPLDQFIKAVSDPTSARARRSAWVAGTALTVRLPTDQASLAVISKKVVQSIRQGFLLERVWP